MNNLNWLLLAMMVVLAGYSAHATRRANSLHDLASALEAQRQQRETLRRDEVELRSRVGVLSSRQDFYANCLGELLSYCHSREDFLVQEGPWLVVGKLKAADKQSQHFGMYLPAGGHVLKYAVADFSLPGQDTHQARQRFSSDDTHQLTQVQSVPLEGTPEVFELRFSWQILSESAEIRVQVIGKENTTVFEQLQEFPADQVKLLFPDRGNVWRAAYPSELQLNDVPRRPTGGQRPSTRLFELSGLTGHSTRSGFRAWIESEASPCIAAIKLGRYFNTVMGWHEQTPIKQVAAFDNLFYPYDGSGKYIFRPGAYESLIEQRHENGLTRGGHH